MCALGDNKAANQIFDEVLAQLKQPKEYDLETMSEKFITAGQSSWLSGRPAVAIQFHTLALAQKKCSAELRQQALLELGSYYVGLKQFKPAVAAFEQMDATNIESESGTQKYYHILGLLEKAVALTHLGDFTQARKIIAHLEAQPSKPGIWLEDPEYSSGNAKITALLIKTKADIARQSQARRSPAAKS